MCLVIDEIYIMLFSGERADIDTCRSFLLLRFLKITLTSLGILKTGKTEGVANASSLRVSD